MQKSSKRRGKEVKSMGHFIKSLFKVHFWDVIKSHYSDFNGRASRPQFWYYQLAAHILTSVLPVPLFIFIAISDFTSAFLVAFLLLLFLVGLFLFIPNLAITVRRLHDTNISGWFILIYLVPIVGRIILLVVLALPSVEQNKFDAIKSG
jgi:uncharacterized membrane protein YhaH (DUF805 family)